MAELTRAEVISTIASVIPVQVDPPAQSPGLAHAEPAPAAGDLIGQNLVVFGPPGTGKSWALDEMTAGSTTLRAVFHPEYSYADFVGAYRPVVGHETEAMIMGHNNAVRPRPVSYFDFVPGAFTLALVKAKQVAPAHVSLIIEEMNRGDCAAVFGDLLQLLDRREDGASRYGVVPFPALGKYLAEQGILPSPAGEIGLPSNLSLLATINSSDQSLFPIDAAFKRRWRWRYLGATEWPGALDGVRVEDPANELGYEWRRVWSEINRMIAELHRVEDRTIGPWYLSLEGNRIPLEEVQGKLLYYLWHDVFKEHRVLAFGDTVLTFGDLQSSYADIGLAGTLRGVVLDA